MVTMTFVPPEKSLPGAQLSCQLLILVWDFLPSSGSPFIGLFCVKMFSLLLAVTLVSRQSAARVAERKRQNKLPPNNCLFCLQQISAQVEQEEIGDDGAHDDNDDEDEVDDNENKHNCH